ncbi:hypothetical protein EP073_09050 [Geovibrio thiophilus]|uniref:Uncharacterized protein n=1 Tax=Geovibrio thiophilus TaxID=139438 RepID=A0A410JZF7_9BACT|nr:hypothetical protein [Geovibrio thiophilus]QAR33542.1 hypothetical protein EP073_09050 [Geovibrio thiophilus]
MLFNRRALYNLILNRHHTFNLITIMLLAYLIPYRSPFTGETEYFNIENMIEGILMTGFFMLFMFMLCRRKPESFLPLVRIVLAMELTAVISPATFLFTGTALKVFMGLYAGWYLSIAVFAFSYLNGITYYRAALAVLMAFFLAQLVPAFFA